MVMSCNMPVKVVSEADIMKCDLTFKHEPELTKKLDSRNGPFDQSVINEITLWKVGRYAHIDGRLLTDLNCIQKTDKRFSRSKIKEILVRLLEARGVGMPMASTFLRFRNPSLFQIMDQRVYRVVYGEEMSLPRRSTVADRENIADIYFAYLNKLCDTCARLKIPFEKSDRILYLIDKCINKGIKLKNY